MFTSDSSETMSQPPAYPAEETKQHLMPSTGYYPTQPQTQPQLLQQVPYQQPGTTNHQQPALVVIGGQPPVQNFVCHIVLACFTFCCCGGLFGLIAFVLAGMLHPCALFNCYCLTPCNGPTYHICVSNMQFIVCCMNCAVLKFMVRTNNRRTLAVFLSRAVRAM